MAKSRSAYSVPGKIGKVERHIIVVWVDNEAGVLARIAGCLLYTSPSPRDATLSRMPSSA